MNSLVKGKANFGTAPVFFTAISTILGAVLFLRFGFAVGSIGFWGTFAIVLIGHAVTIPTAMAIAEIATNQKVEGGGEYYIISRSFGLNVGAAIGIALYLSQAISVAFYIIAFAEAFDPVLAWLETAHGVVITDKRLISLPAMALLSVLMLTKGANLGVQALYIVVVILLVSLVMFFAGSTEYAAVNTLDLTRKIEEPPSFFYVFAIIFPAFTGMTAGVGLSGDLRDPKRSIPLGTLAATVIGMVIYLAIALKLSASASPTDLHDDQLIMSKIALWGPIIPIGLAAATISSALGSIMVAPRTLQALSNDGVFPVNSINEFLLKGRGENKEPFNATLITILLAFVFIGLGDVNAVAEIISMFFMVTYGSICLISFFQHFAGDPSYRPSFKSRWYISLVGALLCIGLMFRMNPGYAVMALSLMVLAYIAISRYMRGREGLVKIFQGVIFQISRSLQVFLQKADRDEDTWRPSIICISRDSFERPAAFDLLRWMSHRYGFGTYIHFIRGYFSKDSHAASKREMHRLIKRANITRSNVYLDTIISPSYTTAIANSLQLPSVSGKEFNMALFEFYKEDRSNVQEIIDNIPLVKAAEFDVCVLSSSIKGFGTRSDIHIWLRQTDFNNASLMILLGYVIIGHPEWKNAQIKIFAVFPENELEKEKSKLLDLIKEGRLPISAHNIELIGKKDNLRVKDIICEKSVDADLVIVGMIEEMIKQRGMDVFDGYETIGNVLFVNADQQKAIN